MTREQLDLLIKFVGGKIIQGEEGKSVEVGVGDVATTFVNTAADAWFPVAHRSYGHRWTRDFRHVRILRHDQALTRALPGVQGLGGHPVLLSAFANWSCLFKPTLTFRARLWRGGLMMADNGTATRNQVAGQMFMSLWHDQTCDELDTTWKMLLDAILDEKPEFLDPLIEANEKFERGVP